LTLESIRALGVSLPNTATAQELKNACSAVKAVLTPITLLWCGRLKR
jgi:hypothetical protein